MKTTLLTLLLTCAVSWAQPGPADPAPSPAGPDPNREAALRQALQDALAGKSNAAVPQIAQVPPTNTAPDATLPPRAVRATPPPTNAPSTTVVVPPALPAIPAATAPPPVVIPSPTATPAAPPVVIPSPAVPGAPPAVVVPPGDQPLPTPPGPGATAGVPASSTIPAPDEIIPAGVINFQGVDVEEVLKIYGELVQRTILRPATLPAPKVFLRTQTALTKREAVQAFDAVLGMNGIAMVNIGDKFVKAVATPNAGQAAAPSSNLSASQLPDIGAYVTHVVQLHYVKPSEMVAALQPFASATPNPILPIDASGILVLRDFTENVKRMLEMIDRVDVKVDSEIISEVILIKYALASEIAQALNSLSAGGGGGSVGGGTTGGRTGGTRAGGSAFGRSNFGTQQGAYPGQTQPGVVNPPGATTPGAGGSSFTDRLQNIIKRASTSGDIQVIGQTKIVADERTNALLIFATKEDMKMIKDIVAKLDVVLAQVLIEAVIIEVNLNDSRDLGVSYIEKQPHPGTGYFRGIGAINNGNSFTQSPLVSSATNIANSLPGGFSYLATLGNDLDVTLTAIANDSRAKVLQRPRIQTSHAVQATLFVGESRPYPTSSYYGGGSFGGYSSIQQLQIGVTLDVTPLINPDGLVVMDIHQVIESANGSVNIANVGDVPITSRKEAQAKVAVRDHDTIILGGLIETSKTKSSSGVPFLMDIPLLGYLFRTTHDSEIRNELIVMIRPTVLPTPEVAALAASAEKAKMPLTRRAEREIADEEARRLRAAEAQEKLYHEKHQSDVH